MHFSSPIYPLYTAVSRKVVGKSARDSPERYCGWFLVHCFSNKFQRMAREAMDVCLRGLKETTKVGSTATVSRTSVLIISHITFRDCRLHSFCDSLSRNSCWPTYLPLRCRFIVARRSILIIKVSRYIHCEGFKFLQIQFVYWNIHIICVWPMMLWSPLLKLGVSVYNCITSCNITVCQVLIFKNKQQYLNPYVV